MHETLREAWRAEIYLQMWIRFPSFVADRRRVRGEPRGIDKYATSDQAPFRLLVAFLPLDDAFESFAGYATGGRTPFQAIDRAGTMASLRDFRATSLLIPTAAFARRAQAPWSFRDAASADAALRGDARSGAGESLPFALHLRPEMDVRLYVRPAVLRAMDEIEMACLPVLAELAKSYGQRTSERRLH